MLKLKHTDGREYEVTGHITFIEDDIERTNYTIVVDGVTETVSSLDGVWTAIEVEDVVPTIVPVPEPEPEPEPAPIVLTQADIEREAWLVQWREYEVAERAIDKLSKAGITPTEQEAAGFAALKKWVADNRKTEYMYFI